MNKVILFLVLLTSTQSFAMEEKKKTEIKKELSQVANSNHELKVGVNGMVCAFCAQGIEKKFKAQKEVENIQVSLENKFIKLKFKEGERLSNDKIAQLLKEAGYDAIFNGEQ